MGENLRTLMCQGPVELMSGRKRKKRHLSLFNDVLVISNNLKKKKFKIKCIIPLNYLCATDDVDLIKNNTTCTCKTIFLLWPTGNFLATFRSKEQKEKWYYFIKRCINEAKKSMNNTFSLQILTEDIPCCDSPLRVAARNIDTVNDIIEKLLPMIQMPNIEDFQLWFCPGQKEAPIPLQGYEYLCDIMTRVQNTLNKSNSSICTAFPTLPGLLVKKLNSETQGQFILKPRDSSKSQRKNTKERPCVITSCCHRGSVPDKDEVCTVPRFNERGKLFGHELSSICCEGKFPTSILDILSVIKTEGTKTEGIFIIPPDYKSFETLKGDLDSGRAVDIRNKSVHDVAWILKEFLVKIKGSLLTSKLNDEWLEINQKDNDKEKIAAVQSLLEKLPPSNAALLIQLFRILYEIEKNLCVTKMSSYSLSMAIAPYILCLPSYHNGLTNDITRKIALVEFMIQNSPEIFGEDVVLFQYETSLFYPSGVKPSCFLDTPSEIGNIREREHGLSSSPGGKSCTPGNDVVLRNPAAPLPDGGMTDLERSKDEAPSSQAAPSKNPPAPQKNTLFDNFYSSAYEGGILPARILDMLSIIEKKGQTSNEIFRFQSGRSFWRLRDKIFMEQQINLDKWSVLTIASVLKDFIRNIQGSLLSSDLYENWLSVTSEASLAGQISAIQSNLLKMPKQNYLLQKLLMRVLSKIKNSPLNQLDTYILSIRIAPYVLWDSTCMNLKIFGSDLYQKMTLIQIMIENSQAIFGDQENILSINSPSKSNKKEDKDSHGGPNQTTSPYNFPQRKLLNEEGSAHSIPMFPSTSHLTKQK